MSEHTVATAPPADVEALVQRLHDCPAVAAVTVTGAGATALAWLLAVPGASRTLLEGRVPYARPALDEILGAPADDYVSQETAAALARAAHDRASDLRDRAAGPGTGASAPAIGVACTATIATARPKRGDHRCWVATHDGVEVVTYGLVLTKGARDRAGEEDVVSRLVLYALAAAASVPVALDLRLRDEERLFVETAGA